MFLILLERLEYQDLLIRCKAFGITLLVRTLMYKPVSGLICVNASDARKISSDLATLEKRRPVSRIPEVEAL